MAEALTYTEVGATEAALPIGYHHTRASAVLGTGRDVFDHAAERLMTWGVQAGAGLVVEASHPRVEVGAEIRCGLRLGPLKVVAPCRVVYVVDEPDRKGWAYGTLPGHPERGEEAFLLRIDDDVVSLEVVAFSKPATWWARLGGVVGRAVQRRITSRYLRALT